MKKQKEKAEGNPLRAIPSEEEVLNEIPLEDEEEIPDEIAFSDEEEARKKHHEYLDRLVERYYQKTRNKNPVHGDIKQLLNQYTHEQLLQSFPEGSTTSVIQELVATGEAAFEFIWYSEMDADLKNAFWVLRRQFEIYSKLLRSSSF